MIGKFLVAYTVISLLQLPLIALAAIPPVRNFLYTESPLSKVVRLLLAALLILAYLPMCFYLAASAAGLYSAAGAPFNKPPARSEPAAAPGAAPHDPGA